MDMTPDRKRQDEYWQRKWEQGLPKIYPRKGGCDRSDFTPEYIKMCETCGLEWTPEVGMWVVHRKKRVRLLIRGLLLEGCEIWLSFDKIIENDWEGYMESMKNVFPLWSQEQLEEKLIKHYMTKYHEFPRRKEALQAVLWDFKSFSDPSYDVWSYCDSGKQLLLCFTMQQLHNRRWTGEGWEVIR